MDHAKLLRTSSFRLSLTFLAIFAVTALSLMAGMYWTTTAFIQRQIRETIDAEIVGLAEQYRERGLGGLVEVISQRANADRERKSLYLLTDEIYRPLSGNLLGWPDAEPDAEGWLSFPVQHLDGKGVQVWPSMGRTFVLSGGYQLLVGRSLRDAEQLEEAIKRSIAWGVALTVLIGVVGGFITSRQLLQRVEGVNRAMKAIMGGDMSRRIPLGGTGDEFDQLADGLNDMLAQIERLVEGIRTVTDNIAHDLRTPLHRLRSRIDVALLGRPDAETCRRTLEEAMADAEGLLATFNALLTIAHAEYGTNPANLEPVDLGSLARNVVELYEPAAEEKGIAITLRAEAAEVRGDRHLLSQALANLLDNAVKYTPDGGTIAVTVEDSASPAVTVADSGPGIPEADRERVFDRFVRLDSTRSTPGNGLGLSLVAAAAKLHGARLELAERQPGLSVRLIFPPAAASQPLA